MGIVSSQHYSSRFAILCIAGVLLCSCTRSESPETSPPEIISYTIEEIDRTPSTNPGDDPPFFNIHAATRLEDGTFLVLDRGDSQIKHCSLSGNVFQTWGGRGSGPGEFSSPDIIALGSDGIFFIPDISNFRLTTFQVGCDYLQTERFPDWIMDWGTPFPTEVTRWGSVIFITDQKAPDRTHPTGMISLRALFATNSTDESPAIYFSNLKDRYSNQRFVDESGSHTYSPPYTPWPSTCISADHLYFTFSDSYKIFAYDARSGSLSDSICIPYEGIPVTRSDYYQLYAGGRTPRSRIDNLEIPTTRSIINALYGPDDRGNIWVLRYNHSFSQDAPREDQRHYDIVDPKEKRIIGTIRTPPYRFIAVNEDILYSWSNSIANQGVILASRLVPLSENAPLSQR